VTDEKLLRVQVAEALGWTYADVTGGETPEQYRMLTGRLHAEDAHILVPPWWQKADDPEWRRYNEGFRLARGARNDQILPPPIPPYGKDSPGGWAATGPLLAKCELTLVNLSHEDSAEDLDGRTTHKGTVVLWAACDDIPVLVAPLSPEFDEGPLLLDGYVETYALGASPCEAIARCVVALAAAGKLPR